MRKKDNKFTTSSRSNWFLEKGIEKKSLFPDRHSSYISFWLSDSDTERLNEYVRKYGSRKDGLNSITFFNRSDFIRSAVLYYLRLCEAKRNKLVSEVKSKELTSPGLLSLSARVDSYLDALRELEVKNRATEIVNQSRSVDNALLGRDVKGLLPDESLNDFLTRKEDNRKIQLKRELIRSLASKEVSEPVGSDPLIKSLSEDVK